MQIVAFALVYGFPQTTSYLRKCAQEARIKQNMFLFDGWQAIFVVVQHRELTDHHETKRSLHLFSRERWCCCPVKVPTDELKNGFRLPTNTGRTSSKTLPSPDIACKASCGLPWWCLHAAESTSRPQTLSSLWYSRYQHPGVTSLETAKTKACDHWKLLSRDEDPTYSTPPRTFRDEVACGPRALGKSVRAGPLCCCVGIWCDTCDHNRTHVQSKVDQKNRFRYLFLKLQTQILSTWCSRCWDGDDSIWFYRARIQPST